MTENYLQAIADGIPGTTIVIADSPECGRVPEQWRAIVESDDPHDRKQRALALWPETVLSRLPRFRAPQFCGSALSSVCRWPRNSFCSCGARAAK